MQISHFTASDGARLAYRDQGQGLPVLALSGLTRTGLDFDYLAPHLPDIRLIRPDYRGRGQSEWTGVDSYTVPQEARDALELLDHLGIERAAILGTSRGGIIGMYLAATAPQRMLGVCLNDVGPILHRAGLEKIKDYVGRNPVAKSHEELALKLPRLMTEFQGVPESRWLEESRRHYIATPDGLRINYDPALRESFLDAFKGPEVDLWPLFDAAKGMPLALIRGQNSDLLSPEITTEMRARRPDMIFAEVPGRGHIPYLDEPEAIAAIHDWLALIR
ncbi:alpha/beta fold hydrolase [Paracoccus aestuariivivens]|uniref:Alpha/beta fold hydrolase n=1 Tax=Paracoccus aestuariivivens TaxID=1820333 RepID=A0A6L6J8D7_9RHOB|nr:alpha/beta hydrolase [Paracoccus aestuariivivens]MTH76394.1 alpha/beta fold hydrolase [Paracoccus aestuariivivens]